MIFFRPLLLSFLPYKYTYTCIYIGVAEAQKLLAEAATNARETCKWPYEVTAVEDLLTNISTWTLAFNDSRYADEVAKLLHAVTETAKTNILGHADVILCTTATIRNLPPRMKVLLFDEAATATDGQLARVLMCGLSFLVLLGDGNQGSYFSFRPLPHKLSLFKSKPIRYMLNVNYRCPPVLCTVWSAVFYNNMVQAQGPTSGDLHPLVILDTAVTEKCDSFEHLRGVDEDDPSIDKVKGGVINIGICYLIACAVQKLLEKPHSHNTTIGVFATYRKQVRALRRILTVKLGSLPANVSIETVDWSQGNEFHFVFFCVERTCNESLPKPRVCIGDDGKAVSVPDRLEWRTSTNVILSRAKVQFVVVGSLPLLVQSKLWRDIFCAGDWGYSRVDFEPRNAPMMMGEMTIASRLRDGKVRPTETCLYRLCRARSLPDEPVLQCSSCQARHFGPRPIGDFSKKSVKKVSIIYI